MEIIVFRDKVIVGDFNESHGRFSVELQEESVTIVVECHFDNLIGSRLRWREKVKGFRLQAGVSAVERRMHHVMSGRPEPVAMAGIEKTIEQFE